MKLDIAPGDIVHLDLALPLKYDDGSVGIDTHDLIRVHVDSVSKIGLTCRFSYSRRRLSDAHRSSLVMLRSKRADSGRAPRM